MATIYSTPGSAGPDLEGRALTFASRSLSTVANFPSRSSELEEGISFCSELINSTPGSDGVPLLGFARLFASRSSSLS